STYRRANTYYPEKCRGHEQDDREEEDDLRKFYRGARDAAKAQHGGDQRNNQEGDSPPEHKTVSTLDVEPTLKRTRHNICSRRTTRRSQRNLSRIGPLRER